MTRTTKECRAGEHCEPATLGQAIQCLLMHSHLTISEIATRVGKSEGYLRKASNADYEELHLQADTLLAASLVTGNLVAVRFLAAQLGCLVVPVPQGAADDDSIYEAFSRAVAKIGHDGDLIRRALSDHTLTHDEAASICDAIDATMEATAAIKQAVMARVHTPLKAVR